MLKNLPQLIIRDLADKGAFSAKGRKARHRIRRATAAGLNRWWHGIIQLHRARIINQRHRAFLQLIALALNEAILYLCEHIHKRISNGNNP